MTTKSVTIEHNTIATDRSYEQVIDALDARLGQRADWESFAREPREANPSWEQVVRFVEQQLGTSGFTVFSKIDPGALLTLKGKRTRATQYAIGNPLLAIQMIEHAPEAALYAPLRLVVYEDHAGKTCIAYECFTSQLAQYPNPQIASIAKLVEEKLEDLVAEVTAGGKHKRQSGT